MNKIPFALGQAAQVAVLPPNAEATYANAAGGLSVFAGLVLSKRGKPRSVLSLTKETYLDVLGDAIQPHEGSAFEPIRHVNQALNGGNGYVVRVTPKSMRIPVLKLSQAASTTSSGTPTIDEPLSYFHVSPSRAQADGTSRVFATFYPKDSNGAVITGLKGLTLNVVNAVNPTITPFQENNGVYTASLSTNTAGTVRVGLSYAADPSALRSKSYDIVFEPAIVDGGRSSFGQSAPSIIADGKTEAIITFFAVDNTGAAVANRTDIDFVISGVNNWKQGPVQAGTTDGSYSVVVTGQGSGIATIEARQNGKIISGPSATLEFVPQQIGTFRDIDEGNSTFEASGNKTQLLNNGNDVIEYHFIARDRTNKPIRNIADELSLVVSGIPAVGAKPGDFTEIATGEYVATLSGTDTTGQTATITLYRGTTAIATKFVLHAQFQQVTLTPTADANASRLVANPQAIPNDGQTASTLTFYANDVNSTAVTGLTNLQCFITGGTGGVLSNSGVMVETSTQGQYTVDLTTQGSDAITVEVRQGTTVLKSTTVQVNAIPTVATAALAISGTAVAGDNANPILVTVSALDAGSLPVSGATNLELVITGLTGFAHTTALVEGTTKGVYEAALTSTSPGTAHVGVRQGANGAELDGKDFTFTAPATSIDAGKSTFTATPGPVDADGTAEITLSFEAKDASGGAMPGLTNIAIETTDNDQYLTLTTLTESPAGTYTRKVKSTAVGDFHFAPQEGGVFIAGKTATATFKAAVATIDATKSAIGLDDLDLTLGTPTIDADGQVHKLKYRAKDIAGTALTGLTGIKFVDKANTGATGITIGAVTENVTEKGLYEADVTFADNSPATAEFWLVTDGATSTDISAALAVNLKFGIDDTKTAFTSTKTQADAGSAGIPIKLVLEGTNGKPLTGQAANITWDMSAVVTISPVVEDAAKAGTYNATVSSSAPVDTVITAKLNGTAIGNGKTLSLKFKATTTAPNPPAGTKATPDEHWSYLDADKNKALADNNEEVTIRFYAFDAQQQPISGLTDLKFTAAAVAGLTIVNDVAEEGTTGVYKTVVKSNKYGTVDFGVWVNSVDNSAWGTEKVTFTPLPSDMDAAKSTFDAAPNPTGVNTASTVTFKALTADDVKVEGLTVEFVPAAPPKATTTITAVSETSEGVYEATVTGTADDTVEFTVKVNSTPVANKKVTVTIDSAVHPAPPPPSLADMGLIALARQAAGPVVLAAPPVYVSAAPAAPGSAAAAPIATGSGSSSAITLSASTIGVGDTVSLGTNEVIAIYVDDGDASADRTIRLEPHPDEDDYWILTLSQVLSQTESRVLEQVSFSLTPDAIDDMGLPAYLPVALENGNSRLRAVVRGNARLPSSYQGFTDQYFIGGSDGDLSTIGPADYQEALNVLAASMVNYTAVLSLGVYDPIVLQALAQHARDVRVDMFCDIRPATSGTNAIQEAADQGLGAFSHVARYHFPYSSRDPITGAQVVYGLSGDAFNAKAKGVAMKPDVGGWHYAPAGYARAVLERSNVKPLAGAASVDREAYVTSRINPVTVASDGSVMIDDSLTTFGKNNYLKYQHVNSILNAIARMTYDVCQEAKHEPDGVTREGLEKEIPRLLERFVASEALVRPRDVTQGEDPFVVVVTQEEFDLWSIKVFVCPTGVARRIAVEPILFR